MKISDMKVTLDPALDPKLSAAIKAIFEIWGRLDFDFHQVMDTLLSLLLGLGGSESTMPVFLRKMRRAAYRHPSFLEAGGPAHRNLERMLEEVAGIIEDYEDFGVPQSKSLQGLEGFLLESASQENISREQFLQRMAEDWDSYQTRHTQITFTSPKAADAALRQMAAVGDGVVKDICELLDGRPSENGIALLAHMLVLRMHTCRRSKEELDAAMATAWEAYKVVGASGPRGVA